ncbi:MAG: single-stranded DNA-binding protein [Paludisphaera borealis]|uniref:single-stranded DNA-binding protein n=1 Tax=Paludisphaera borealis TaxID=1387353 RepID=UPI00283DD6DD|nr:single-stranded DNA-binding protein [Paludisphaera borealis]MDR3619956.1 single-stranded DNA-binding protein [Paludisphaera borealis]
MPDLNRVQLMGRLTFDPELRRIPSGTAVTELRMAVNRSWQGRDGDRREEVLYIDVTAWDRQAETCCQILRKGSLIFVEGSLKMDQWDDKTTGEKRSKMRVQADRVQFLDSRRDGGGGGSGGGMGDDEYGAPPMQEPAPRRAAPQRAAESRGPARDDFPRASAPSRAAVEPDHGNDDDIPF